MIVIVPLLLLYFVYALYRRLFPPPRVNASGKYVLISGCDSGFGYLATKRLEQLGFHIVATCLTDDGFHKLSRECSSRVIPVKVDITQENEVEALYTRVAELTDQLHALVNNAGIAIGSYVDTSSMSEYHKVMDVNFFGHVHMTKRFLSLLIKGRGRIVNLSSAAGLIAGQGLSCYSSSKFALEAFSDACRREFHCFGVKVAIIEPGFMNTPMVSQQRDWIGIFRSLPAEKQERWGVEVFEAIAKGQKTISRMSEDPMLVVTDMVDAVTSTSPRLRYHPGVQSKLLSAVIAPLPTYFQDLVFKLQDWTANRPKPKATVL